MKIIIIGGGDVGSTIAEKLISEGHDITIVEQNPELVKKLQNELDAMVVRGNGVDNETLEKANLSNSSLFLAVTNNDNINIISCQMAKILSNNNIKTVAKVENYYSYFSDKKITPSQFNIDEVIASKRLSIEKITTLIEQPEAIENIHFVYKKVQLIGIKIENNYAHKGRPIKEIVAENPILRHIRFIAIYRHDQIIIPSGDDVILSNDKIYLIGKSKTLEDVLKIHFDPKIKIKNIVINGGNRIGKELAKILSDKGKKVTIIENDSRICQELAEELDDILVINGSGTDQGILSDIETRQACVVSVTDEDEYNVISAVSAKQHQASKAICLIRNIALAPIINQMAVVDTVFSPDILTSGEILRFCRQGNVLAVSSFSEINAETIKIHIEEPISILNTPLSEIKFPQDMILGAVIRDEKVIIPTGDTQIMLNDIVIVFLLPTAVHEVEKIFSQRFKWRF